MDILNWLYLKKEQLIRTTANNAETDLVALGANVGFAKRDDQYQTYAMPLKNLVEAGNQANTAHYELDITASNIVTVNTTRGIIDILGMGTSVGLTPDLGFLTSTPFYINNPDLDLSLTNRDNIYVQYSLYYSPAAADTAIPYLISTGAITGLQFNLYNASGITAGGDQWTGELYVYFELYTIN